MSTFPATRRQRKFQSAHYLNDLFGQRGSLMDAASEDAICQRIKQARKDTGMTQEDMANALGVTLRAYQNYEGSRVPFRRLRDISELTGKSQAWLLRGEEEAGTPESTGRHLEDIEVKLDRLTTVVEHLAESLAAARSDPDDGRSGQTGS